MIERSASVVMTSIGIFDMNRAWPRTGKKRKSARQDLRQLIGCRQGVAEGCDARDKVMLRREFMEADIAHAKLLPAIDGRDDQHGDGIGIRA